MNRIFVTQMKLLDMKQWFLKQLEFYADIQYSRTGKKIIAKFFMKTSLQRWFCAVTHFLSSCNQISINFQTPYKMSDLAKFYFLLLLFGNTKLRFDTSDISSIGHLVLTFECWKIFPFSLDYITFHWYWNFL